MKASHIEYALVGATTGLVAAIFIASLWLKVAFISAVAVLYVAIRAVLRRRNWNEHP
jgi:hypothetical protein